MRGQLRIKRASARGGQLGAAAPDLYLFALDFRDADAYAATFAEDGVLDDGAGKLEGRAAIRAMVAGMRENAARQRAADTSGLRPAAGRHNISNIVLEIDGDRATGTA